MQKTSKLLTPIFSGFLLTLFALNQAHAFPVGSAYTPADDSSKVNSLKTKKQENQQKLAPKEAGPVRFIVIDPGHGGKDDGATGPTGLKEKDITLKIAKELKTMLTQMLGAKVVLTRTEDKYLALSERTAFANKLKADIFISIHINASVKRRAKGVETYFLSYEASDDESRKVAAFENDVVRLDGKTHGAPANDIEAILWDLTKTAAHQESSRLAESILNPLVIATKGVNRGVKQAPFYVLMGATMPAVLLEVGFISNRKEERQLARKITQKKIANAITKGMVRFEETLKKSKGLVKLKGKGD